jgi:uncharacterized protein DUF932
MVIQTLDSLIERVLAEDARKHDILADTRRMSVAVEAREDKELAPRVRLDVDDSNGIGTFYVSDHALGQMATDLGVPKRYFDRMKVEAPDLFKTNVHHWMYETPNRRMIRSYTHEDQSPATARAWLSDRFRRLDNIEIAKKLLPEFDRLSEEVAFHNASVTDEKFYLRAVFPRMQAPVKVGDDVQWGVQIKNSEVGAAQFSIDSFVMRLACINGMVVAKVMSARHVGKRLGEHLSDEAIAADDRAFWLAARDELRNAISETEFERVVAVLRDSTDGAAITAPIAATERLAKTFDLSDGEKEAVLTKLAAGGDFSKWGALNAVTAAAQTVESFDRRVEMEEIGWDIANLPNREWERIAVAA